MFKSPYATSLTKFGERDMTNGKRISFRRPRMGGRYHPEQHFKLTKTHAKFHNNYREACGLAPLPVADIIG